MKGNVIIKKRIFPLLVILATGLFLTACVSSQAATTFSGVIVVGNDTYRLTVSEKLALGTLKLEDTDQAVDAAQAAVLLPLWKAAQNLSTSQTISTMEMDALYAQIRGAMTQEQIKTIEAMDFSEAEVTQMESSLGVGLEVASLDAACTPTQPAGQAGVPADGMGAPPDAAGMLVGMDANGFSPQANGTSSTTTNESSSAALPTRGNVFLEPLISMLKEIAATAQG